MTNDEKLAIMKKRKILLYLLVVFGLATIVLSLFSLSERDNPIFLLLAIVSFLIEAIISNYRNKLDPKGVKSGSKN